MLRYTLEYTYFTCYMYFYLIKTQHLSDRSKFLAAINARDEIFPNIIIPELIKTNRHFKCIFLISLINKYEVIRTQDFF